MRKGARVAAGQIRYKGVAQRPLKRLIKSQGSQLGEPELFQEMSCSWQDEINTILDVVLPKRIRTSSLIHNTPRERQVKAAAAFSAPDLEVGTCKGSQLARTESNGLCLPQEYLLTNYAQAVTLTFSERSYRPFRVKCCE